MFLIIKQFLKNSKIMFFIFSKTVFKFSKTRNKQALMFKFEKS